MVGKVRAVIAAVVVIVALIGAAFALGVLGTPGVTGVENRFAGVNDSTTLIATELRVNNPNPIGVALGGVSINYTVDLNDVRMARGDKRGVRIAAGNSTLRFRTAMNNERIPEWWVSHVRNGERSTLVVTATVRSSTLGQSTTLRPVEREIPTDILSAFNSTETRPVNANQPVVSDPVLYVNETGAAWGEVTSGETPIEMRFVAYNPKSVPYAVTEIGYSITMNGIAVGEGTTERTYTLPPRTERTLAATTIIRNGRLDEWWVSHLERNQVTELRIDFYARVELPTGNTVRVPLDRLTYTETIETDVFGTKNSTGDAGSNATGTATPGTPTPGATEAGGTATREGTPGGDTPTPGDGTPTAAPTATPTPTPTATETGTGDGGLL